MSPEPALSPEQVARLCRPEAYPEDASAAAGVESVQTHISHVFLTGGRVYKFRKAVDLGFLCFATRGQRNADCLREVALNRRLAPDVYLGVAPLFDEGRVGSVAEDLDAGPPVPEHCVVMRRLPARRDALSLLEQGGLRPEQLDRLAVHVASFHDSHGLGTPAPFTAEAWRARVFGPVLDNFRALGAEVGEAVPEALLRESENRERAFRESAGERFERRRQDGRAVDGHGDLHLDHVWFERDDDPPLLVDCIEFNEDLRRIDAASEVAFLSMDLRYRRHPELAERFLARYAAERDDFDLYGVVDWFEAYRAAVRAKVAAIAAREPEIDEAQRGRAAESARRHLGLASQVLGARSPGRLLLVAGVVGTGKSTAARVAADALRAAVVSSDRVRKRLAGLAPRERGDADLYTRESTERTYAALLERARPVLQSGRVCVLDATFSARRHRDAARALARELGTASLLLEVQCAEAVALERLAARAAAGDAVSDAGPELYRSSVAGFEPVDEWPEGRHLAVRTDVDGWEKGLRAALKAL